MNIKKKLAMGIATGALAVSMIGGGTYAYFNDVETSVNTFAAGTLDLAVNPETIIDVSNIKPGDWMYRNFKLENNGSLDISKVLLTTEFTESVGGFGDHIVVEFLINEDKSSLLGPSNVIDSMTLSELANMSADAVKNESPKWFGWQGGEDSGLKAGTKDNLHVMFRFNDNNEDQNAYQGANLELKWKFDAQQTKGVLK
ncbi:cell division protein FtsN [Sporosarcina sp. ANT_H38]|uniref:TasA family protein n=1 Tax=Sporosarcina sp. ANT_H38 TaxID=2597358 RepID=UPI0011F2D371|nr:TasA family protein [Sporosarcina sp. ANT_H38]KAA0955499.1 cell division protein FtsN [Sporosarcina sp. ANT_H38]